MQRRRQRILSCLILLIAAPATCVADDSLSGLRDDVRTPSPDKPKSERRDDDSDEDYAVDSDDLLSEEGESFLGVLALGTVSSPFWGPHILMNDHFGDRGEFLSYPYKHSWDGNMLIDDSTHFTKWWQLRLSAEYADDFDGLSATGGYIFLDTSFRLGLDTSFVHREEEIAPFQKDGLWTGDVNLVFRFAQNEFMQMRTGAGANWLADDSGTNWGFNFTYGGDLMPLNPFVLSSEIDWGRLWHTDLFHWRATAGVEFRHFELYTGFDYYDVGQTQIHGWLVGTRLWF